MPPLALARRYRDHAQPHHRGLLPNLTGPARTTSFEIETRAAPARRDNTVPKDDMSCFFVGAPQAGYTPVVSSRPKDADRAGRLRDVHAGRQAARPQTHVELLVSSFSPQINSESTENPQGARRNTTDVPMSTSIIHPFPSHLSLSLLKSKGSTKYYLSPTTKTKEDAPQQTSYT